MKTRQFSMYTTSGRLSAVLFFLSVLLVLLITMPAFGVTLLSDTVISEISAGAGDTISVWMEDNQHGSASDSYYYGDTDGVPEAPRPGYLIMTLAPPGFQSAGIPGTPGYYTNFEYRFTSQADANRFRNRLASSGSYANIRQRTTYSHSSANHLLLNDGSAPKVVQVTVITDKEVGPGLVHQFNGTVVEEPVVLNLHFPKIGKTGTTFEQSADGRRQYYNYQWIGHEHQYGKPGWPNDSYQSASVEITDHRYGKLTELGTGYSDTPIRDSATNILVPADTAFIKTTMGPMEITSPEIALGFALASHPAAPCYTTDGCGVIGVLRIHKLTIKMSGTPNNGDFGKIDDGNGIYLYARDN